MGGAAYVGRDYVKNNHGYDYLYVWRPDHPNANKTGHIPQHRLVASEMLGRPLRPGEVVHHRNGVTTDNAPENLHVMPLGEHTRLHRPRRRVSVQCSACGKTLDRKFCDTVRKNPKHFYCSSRCSAIGHDTRVLLACRVCGTEFRLCAAHARRSKRLCSHTCQQEQRNRDRHSAGPPLIRR